MIAGVKGSAVFSALLILLPWNAWAADDMAGAIGDLGEHGTGRDGAAAAGGHGGRGVDGGVVAVAQLAVAVLTPAVGGAGRGQRAGVLVGTRDLGEGHAGQHDAGVHGHWRERGGVVIAADLAVGVVAPAVGFAAVDGAGALVAFRDAGRNCLRHQGVDPRVRVAGLSGTVQPPAVEDARAVLGAGERAAGADLGQGLTPDSTPEVVTATGTSLTVVELFPRSPSVSPPQQ